MEVPKRCGRRHRPRRSKNPDARPPPLPSSSRDWSDLPLDVVSYIFSKMAVVDVLIMGPGLVCNSWLDAAKNPNLYRHVEMERHEFVVRKKMNSDVLRAMAKVAIDRSDGQLEVFAGQGFVDDELLCYIAERSPSLKSLCLISCKGVTNKGFTKLVASCPLIEELLISYCPDVGGDVYAVIGKACLQLKRLLLETGLIYPQEGPLDLSTMHQLRYLTIIVFEITTEELLAIVNSCPHLERLCVRHFNAIVIDDNDDLRVKCAKIKKLILGTVPICKNADDEGYYWYSQKFNDWRFD